MTREEIRECVIKALREIAPEIEPSNIKPDLSMRDQLDIDSVDFLNFIIGLHKAFNVEIPETDYPSLYSLDGCIDYFAERVR